MNQEIPSRNSMNNYILKEFIFIISGNVLVIWTVVRVFKTKNVTNMFICSLAVADLFVATVCIPFRVN